MRKFSPTKLNICVSVLHQMFTAVCGLVSAKVILQSFGAENHGLMQSVGQLLGYTVLLEGGIGGVMRAAFYKPLAEHDSEQVSDIFNGGRNFLGGMWSRGRYLTPAFSPISRMWSNILKFHALPEAPASIAQPAGPRSILIPSLGIMGSS